MIRKTRLWQCDNCKAVENVRLALKKAYKLGVVLISDTCSDNLYAYSGKDVLRTDYDCATKAFTEFGARVNDLCVPVGEDIITLSMDDTSIYVKFE